MRILDQFITRHVSCATCADCVLTLFGPVCRSLDRLDGDRTAAPIPLGVTTSNCEAHRFASPRLDRISDALTDREWRQVWRHDVPEEVFA